MSRRWPLALAALLPLAVTIPASAAPRTGERPPECVRVLVEYNSGAGPDYHWRFCGAGSGADSPLHDSVRVLIFDGGAPGPGSVIFPGG